jgi:hypothetical protein
MEASAAVARALGASIRLALLLLLPLLLLRILDRVRWLGLAVFTVIVGLFGVGEMMALGDRTLFEDGLS